MSDAQEITMEVGQWYRTRNGELVKCVCDARAHTNKEITYPMVCVMELNDNSITETYKPNGKYANYVSARDIVETVTWIYEDELPQGYLYAANFHLSRIDDGVRMFPAYPSTAEEVSK